MLTQEQRSVLTEDEIRQFGAGGWWTFVFQDLADARLEAKRLREAIESCIAYANGRQCEWGDRALNAFEFLEKALERKP